MKSEASRASLLRFSAASVGLTTPLYSIGWSYEAYLLMLRGKGAKTPFHGFLSLISWVAFKQANLDFF